jgi:hypothetical protein
MRISRWVAAPCIVSLLAVGTVVGTATTAVAIPSDCTISYGSAPRPGGGTQLTASSFCASGTGEHRIYVRQQHFDPTAGPIVCIGPWAPVGASSTTGITPHQIVEARVEKR